MENKYRKTLSILLALKAEIIYLCDWKNRSPYYGLHMACNEERAFFASEEHKNIIYGLVKK